MVTCTKLRSPVSLFPSGRRIFKVVATPSEKGVSTVSRLNRCNYREREGSRESGSGRFNIAARNDTAADILNACYRLLAYYFNVLSRSTSAMELQTRPFDSPPFLHALLSSTRVCILCTRVLDRSRYRYAFHREPTRLIFRCKQRGRAMQENRPRITIQLYRRCLGSFRPYILH